MRLLTAIMFLIPLFASTGTHPAPRSEPRYPVIEFSRQPIRHGSTYCTTCKRDIRGRIKSSRAVRRRFQRENPCPANCATAGPCPGYVVDHVQALKHGGKDDTTNMQWESVAEAKANDRVED